ncbi:MAG TPA: CpaD family pilus assembly protein [Caulobacteraceae bacterium]
MMIRASLILLASLALTACATDDDMVVNKPAPATALTPTERFAIEVREHPEELKLAPHAQGLSPNQITALGAFVDHWNSVQGGDVLLKAPSNGADPQAAYRTTVDARDYLLAHGLDPQRVKIVGYDAAGDRQAPVLVGYAAYVAKGPRCGQDWENLTATKDNREYNNFGCAMSANIAAEIANPADLLSPRQMDPADAARRQTVLDHYRKGESTSTVKDDQANGAVSTAVH